MCPGTTELTRSAAYVLSPKAILITDQGKSQHWQVLSLDSIAVECIPICGGVDQTFKALAIHR